jgi:AcrR family transcriptional regulator
MATPRSVPVDRTTLVAVAADLADREGWHAMTLSDVAKAVGRHPSSMYAHVESLDDLRHEIALLAMNELAEKVWRAVLGKIGADALLAIAETYRDFARDFPGRTASLSWVREDDPEFAVVAARLHEPVHVTFRSFGLTDQQTAVAHRVFDEDIHQAVGVFLAAMETGHWPAH